MPRKHTPPPEELDLKEALHEERHLFEKADVPIVTVSATYRKELAKKHRSIAHTASDVIYSRAHYSMAEAVRQQAVLMGKTAHLTDPTNFVSKDDWRKVELTQNIGRIIARHKFLKIIKDKTDRVTRNKLPISKAIVKPLLYMTGRTTQPIISMHYETGNILSKNGKIVIQAITDPHVHIQYLDALPDNDSREKFKPQITYAVFDEDTRKEFFRLTEVLGKKAEADQVKVTGPFVDPRICSIGSTVKKLAENKPVNIAITTGGIGTNLKEIKKVLESFKPLLVPPEKVRLFLFAGVHRDFRNFFEDYAKVNHVRIGDPDDENARIRILFDDSIIDANENLIRYMFPWAHGIITKPSGDMAYDAAAAGCFIFFLEPWGKQEEYVQKVFEKPGVGFDLDVKNAGEQFLKLLNNNSLSNSLENAHKLPPVFRRGCKNLINLHSTVNKI